MADCGVNLVRCHNRSDLDRAQAAGMMGWVPLRMELGDSNDIRKKVESLRDHPALAVWEGPDEIVDTFTAAWALYWKGIAKTKDAWFKQVPDAVEYGNSHARKILPKLREGIQLVRSLDEGKHQIWINETIRSDLKFVRQYIDGIDITGCDLYPVTDKRREIERMGSATERWKQVGRGQKAVWMVLQAFSWSELGKKWDHEAAAYPSFAESRFMAYDVIVHGARGILYWGSHYLKCPEFRQSIYALTSELAALQPFLVAPQAEGVRVNVINHKPRWTDRGVIMTARKVGAEWLVILVNDDDRIHLAVEVTGLEELNGRQLSLLYGSEDTTVEHGELITRMMPYEVQVFATSPLGASRKYETSRRTGRDYKQEDNVGVLGREIAE
jgi:hypothetical protein